MQALCVSDNKFLCAAALLCIAYFCRAMPA